MKEKIQESQTKILSQTKLNNKEKSIRRRLTVQPAQQEQVTQNTCQKQFKTSLNSMYCDYLIITLVIIYTLLIFIYFALDNNENADDQDIQLILHIVQIIEMLILIVFALEIILKSWAFRLQEYFKDIWYILDAIIIFISIILLGVDLSVDDENYKTISKIVRGIFRFLRLFLVFRKVTQFKQIKSNLLIHQTKTPVERLLEIFRKLKDNVDENEYIVTFDWSIEMISNNELYKPMFQKEDKEAAKWTSNFDHKDKKFQTTKVVQTLMSVELPFIDEKHHEKIPLPSYIQSYFFEKSNIELIDFDVFGFHGLNKGNELSWLIVYLFQYKNNICQELQINPKKLFDFIGAISSGYLEQNPYHNKIHAFDVTSTVNFLLSSCNFIDIGKVSKFDLSYMYIGAACHDYEHPGVNNMFLINTKSSLATRYNDKSPLENHHVSGSFVLIRQEQYEILQNFTKSDYKLWRERMIAMILATDMSVHFADLAKLKGRLASAEFDPKIKDKALCLDSILHASDISNPFKPFQLYQPWAKRVLQEFWNQGDQEREKGLAISYLCDRYTVNTAKSQLGFIDFIVKPFYETIAKFMPLMQPMLTIFEENKEKWKEEIDFYDTELDGINAAEENSAKQHLQ